MKDSQVKLNDANSQLLTSAEDYRDALRERQCPDMY